ncbi:MAG: hypothetical protein VX278_20775 [Myxococcota bacterium]|nr:hypothetical protein [Myxococcota bacterium]
MNETMGTVLLSQGNKRRRLILSSSNLIGRHWRCELSISNERLPLYWIEIRWLESHWAWRVLWGSDFTRGTGAVLQRGWRKWSSGRIYFHDILHLELSDPSPPTLLFEELRTKKRFTLMDLEGRVLYTQHGVQTLYSEQVYQDGEILTVGENIYRVHLPVRWSPSKRAELDLGDAELALDIDVETLEAVFTVKNVECKLMGEPVRMLYVYARHRKEDPDGWLSSENAFRLWVEFGGTTTSPIERLNWERAKVRNMLAMNSAINTEQIFERTRKKRKWLIRMRIKSQNINI